MDALAATTTAATTTTTTAANRDTTQFEAVDAETRSVLQSRINPNVRGQYEDKNINFILWLFDNHEHYSELLQPALLNKLVPQQERDKPTPVVVAAPGESYRNSADQPLVDRLSKGECSSPPKNEPVCFSALR